MAEVTGGAERPPMEMHKHHGDVSGGWLRPAVFGMMDGLVSNFALISGVVGGGAQPRTVVLTGLAGLVAGACSMATGEYTSVASQSEHVRKEIERERAELARNPEGEHRELIAMYESKGLSSGLASQVADELSKNPEELWRVHVREEMGVDPDDLPSPWLAAGSSFAAFSIGALIPVVPYLFGATTIVVALVLSLLGLFVSGAVVARLTSVSPLYGGLRQLVLGAAAAIVTFGAGTLVGQVLG